MRSEGGQGFQWAVGGLREAKDETTQESIADSHAGRLARDQLSNPGQLKEAIRLFEIIAYLQMQARPIPPNIGRLFLRGIGLNSEPGCMAHTLVVIRFLLGTASGPTFCVSALVHQHVRASLLTLTYVWKTEAPQGSAEFPHFHCNPRAVQFWHHHSDMPGGAIQELANRQKSEQYQAALQEWTQSRRGTAEEFKLPWQPRWNKKTHVNGFSLKPKQSKLHAARESQEEPKLQRAIAAQGVVERGPGTKGYTPSPHREPSPRRRAGKERATLPAPSPPPRQCKPHQVSYERGSETFTAKKDIAG